VISSNPADNRIILKADGYGANPEKAKKIALSQLSQTIISSVKANLEMKQEQKDGIYSESLKNDINVESNVLLKGVEYSKPVKEGKEFKVTASMSIKAVKNTLGYLVSILPENIDNQSSQQYDSILTNIYLTLALLYAVTENDISAKSSLVAAVTALKDEIFTRINFGSIVITTEPSDAVITLSGKQYKSGSKIYLPPDQDYTFTIARDGYRNMTGKFYLYKGDKRSAVVEMMKNLGRKVPVYVKVDAPVRLVDDVERVLLDFGIIPTEDPETPHAIMITMKGTTITVDKYRKYKLELDLHTFKNKVKYKITHYEHTPFFVTPETEESLIRENCKKVAEAVVKQFLTKIDLNDFLSE